MLEGMIKVTHKCMCFLSAKNNKRANNKTRYVNHKESLDGLFNANLDYKVNILGKDFSIHHTEVIYHFVSKQKSTKYEKRGNRDP